MRIFLFAFFILGSIAFSSCKDAKRTGGESSASIAVSWELVSNFTSTPTGFDARFKFVNGDTVTLTDKNWALFFSMSPRAITATKNNASLEHINGDWYRLVPKAGFRLAPGDSVDIAYSGIEAIIKETDAPMGLYFVFYDEAGKESRVAEVEDFKVVPFTRKDQMLRGTIDLYAIPTARKLYQDNLELSRLSAEKLLPVIPTPVQVKQVPGELNLSGISQVVYTPGLENEASLLAGHWKNFTGQSLVVSASAKPVKGSILLSQGKVSVAGKSTEAYQLNVGENGIQITGGDAAGVFYGTQSLLAMLSPDKSKATIPFVEIEDAPRYEFRSMHLDVARNFQTKESVKRVLDVLAFYKINHLLLYTTEDEGWRVEIDGLPELTEVGGLRAHTSEGYKGASLHPAYGSGPKAYEKGKHGSGFYTRADFIEILRHAAARHITVIPEVNFPGHARAAIKAMEVRYNRLMKEGKKEEAEEYRLIDPDDRSEYLSAQFYKDNVVSVGRESVYRFYEKVMDEYIRLYKEAGLTLKKVHIGGDEVATGAWTKSPMIDQLLKKDPSIKGVNYLQAYFLRRLLPSLKKRGFEVHGWEEVALNKTDKGEYIANPEFAGKGVIPYIWNNTYDPDLGYRLANAGYPVVLCNVTNFYFDMAHNNDPREPGLYWAGFVNARSNWEFEPYDMFKTTRGNSMGGPIDFSKVQKLKPEARKNIIGIEAQLWSETVKGREMMEHYILPKLVGFSESAWASQRVWEGVDDKAKRAQLLGESWNIFANTIAQRELPRLNVLSGGYTYQVPAPGAVIEDGTLKANVAYPGLVIRYTTDGKEPDKNSTIYNGPVQVSGKVKVRSFDLSGRKGSLVLSVE